jgi:uncharacterized protein (DUF1015 family)
MAKVFPFRPYRYSATAGSLDSLVTQPYDKISPEMQSRYLSLSPNNLVRVILGERHASDNDTDNVYTRAAKYLNEWISSGVLVRDETAAFYPYSQEFQVPDTNERAVRRGFIGLGAVEPYSAGSVYRHEQTLSGPKRDRMELLKHTRAHFGQIFMLYPDREFEVEEILEQVMAENARATVTDEYGTIHRLWRVADEETVRSIQMLMSDKRLLIADGHHRYETALAFHQQYANIRDAERVMMNFVNMYSPGLKILATHRLVFGLNWFTYEKFVSAARAEFEIRELDSVAALQTAWGEPHKNRCRIGAYTSESGKILLLERERYEHQLDVSLLHDIVLHQVLAINEDDVRDERHIRYVRGAEAAIEQVRNGAAQIALLLEPVAIEQMADIAFSGGVMPQKSTDFYPKLLSGLTIYKLEQ